MFPDKTLWYCSFEAEETQCECDNSKNASDVWIRIAYKAPHGGPRSAYFGDFFVYTNIDGKKNKEAHAL